MFSRKTNGNLFSEERFMGHTCHWPGCNLEVPPKLWGCKPHWFRLPKRLRDKVWASYRPGQEIDKRPSMEYLGVVQEVECWILTNQSSKRKETPCDSLFRS